MLDGRRRPTRVHDPTWYNTARTDGRGKEGRRRGGKPTFPSSTRGSKPPHLPYPRSIVYSIPPKTSPPPAAVRGSKVACTQRRGGGGRTGNGGEGGKEWIWWRSSSSSSPPVPHQEEGEVSGIAKAGRSLFFPPPPTDGRHFFFLLLLLQPHALSSPWVATIYERKRGERGRPPSARRVGGAGCAVRHNSKGRS